MPVAKLSSGNSLDAMKLGQKIGKPEKGTDSLDNFIKQAIGKEPVLSRTGDGPVQWIQLLHALDQQDLSGWPLLTPPKIQMQKCEKCAREFCAPINYRRHIRVHRRSLNIDKDPSKTRDLLREFWDKLSLEDAKEVISFKDVMLEEVPGSSIVRALTSFIRKPGYSSVPQVHLKAGTALLDLVQSRASRFPLTSMELFSILDDASEKTFLCPGTAVSMQKFMFDGEPGKIGLEIKNLIACTSFLVEQKLVKAWIADKDAEALRCHKLLVEEEEAAERRHSELLERKRLKKLRQKEQRAKEHDEEVADLKESDPDSLETVLAEAPIPEATSDLLSHTPEVVADLRLQSTDEEANIAVNLEFDSSDNDPAFDNLNTTNYHNVDHRTQQGGGQRHLVGARRPVQNAHRGGQNGFHSGHLPPLPKLGTVQKNGIYRDHRASSQAHNHKVWTRKTKSEKEVDDSNGRVRKESKQKTDQNENCEVLIGSISIALGDCNGQSKVNIMAAALDHCAVDHQAHGRNSVQEKSAKPDSGPNGLNRTMKHWRPVGRHEAWDSILSDKKEAEMDVISDRPSVDRTSNNENCLRSSGTDDCSAQCRMDYLTVPEEGAESRGPRLFSSRAAQAFLSQRWKEAIAADHVKLVLYSPESESPGCTEIQQDDAQVVAPVTPPESCNCNILCSAENRLVGVNAHEPAASIGATKTKFRTKNEKGYKLKYIPKQRNHT